MGPTSRTERQSDNHRWDCLQRFLAGLKPGEAVTINGVAARTGLGADSVDLVLQALTRADMFAQRNPTTFVRDSYFSLLFALRESPEVSAIARPGRLRHGEQPSRLVSTSA
jgi:hypothetical protein